MSCVVILTATAFVYVATYEAAVVIFALLWIVRTIWGVLDRGFGAMVRHRGLEWAGHKRQAFSAFRPLWLWGLLLALVTAAVFWDLAPRGGLHEHQLRAGVRMLENDPSLSFHDVIERARATDAGISHSLWLATVRVTAVTASVFVFSVLCARYVCADDPVAIQIAARNRDEP